MNNEVTVVMASFPPRKDGMLLVVKTLLPQCDRMCLYLNGYDERPEELPDDPKLEIVLAGPNSAAPDKGSQGKHHWLDKYPDGYYLTVDDDIHYPADYVEKMVAAIERYGRTAIVTVHGTLYRLTKEGNIPAHGLARAHKTIYQYEQECLNDIPVHVCGNGCSGFCPSSIGMTTAVSGGSLHSGDDEDCAIFTQMNAIPIVRIHTKAHWLRTNEAIMPIFPQFRDPSKTVLQDKKIRAWTNPWRVFPAVRAPNPSRDPAIDKPLLTVSMTTYKTPPGMLRRAVLSVLGQTEARLKLIVVNDGGGKEVWDELKGIADPRVLRLDMPENVGTYACHAKTLSMCDTPWWSPHDSDDYCTNDRYAHLLELADEDDEVLLGGWTEVYQNGSVAEQFPQTSAKSGTTYQNFRWVSLWGGGLWRTSWLRRAGGINPAFRVAYDSALQTLALMFTGVQVVKHTGYMRTVHADALTQHPETGYSSQYRRQTTEYLDLLLGQAAKQSTIDEAGKIMAKAKGPFEKQRACAEKRNVGKSRHETSCKPYLPKLRSGAARPARIPQGSH